MRTVIRGTASQDREVTSGVPQGSVLGPIMFLVYVNDLGDDISKNSYINMFADASTKRPMWEYKRGDEKIPSADREKYPRIVINNKHHPDGHIQ